MINKIISEGRKRTTVLKRQQVTVATLNCNVHSEFVSMLANIERSQRDAEPDVPCACTQGAVHSKIFKSRISAHRHAYRASLRSSSELEPRHPPLKVIHCQTAVMNTAFQTASFCITRVAPNSGLSVRGDRDIPQAAECPHQIKIDIGKC